VGSRDIIKAVKVEALEQRILLSADLVVPDSRDLLRTQAAETVSVSPQTPTSTTTTGLPLTSTPDPLTVHSPSGATLDLSSAPAGERLDLAQGYMLTGSGLWDGPLVNTGTVAPGESPGVLSVQTFEQNAGATLKLEIGGTTPGPGGVNLLAGHDQVAVGGLAQLAGTLSLDFINDFRPTAGQVFDVMTWTSRQGSFSSYTGLYAGNGIYLKPIYEPNRLRLIATALPGLDQLSVVPQAQRALDQWLSQLANNLSQTAVTLDASVEVGGMRLSGQWRVAVALLTNNQIETTWAAIDVGAQWTLPGLQGSLSGINGSLVLGPNALQINLSGQGALSVGDGPALSGRMNLAYQAGALAVTASGVSLQIGEPARGPAVALSNGSLTLSSGAGQYQLQLSGTGTVQALAGVSFQGQLLYSASSSTPALLKATGATLQLGELGSVTGDLSFTSSSRQADGQTIQELILGARVSSARLQLGALVMNATQGSLGLVWGSVTPTTGLGHASRYTALRGDLDLTVALDSAVTLHGQRVRISYNTLAESLRRDIVLPDGQSLMMDLAAAQTQISGRFRAEIAGLASFEGDLALDATQRVRLLSNGQAIELTEYALPCCSCC
jgi:hypothetical protein